MKNSVTVVIPTYYRNELLRDAIESTRDNQSVVSEIIVVDGSGESNAETVISEFEDFPIDIEYIPQNRDRGVAAAREEGIKSSNGDYIRFLDDDDLLIPQSVAKQVQRHEDTGAGVIYGAVEWPNGDIIHPNPEVSGDVLERVLSLDSAPCYPSTMLVEKQLFDQIPPLQKLPSDDNGLKIELAQLTSFEFIDSPVARRNGDGGGLGQELEVALNRKRTVDEYRELYKNFPPSIYRNAKKTVHIRESHALLSDSIWSPRAIFAGAKSAYYGRDVQSVGFFISTLFGRPGRDLGKSVYRTLQSSVRTGNY
jgi:glycosyltransferase involved in cell wall biosynthesis